MALFGLLVFAAVISCVFVLFVVRSSLFAVCCCKSSHFQFFVVAFGSVALQLPLVLVFAATFLGCGALVLRLPAVTVCAQGC